MKMPRRASGRQKKTKIESYSTILRLLMEFIHHRPFPEDHRWTREELLEVKPDLIMRFLKKQVYDDEEADPDHAEIKKYRSNTIKCWKKAWSFFMPNKMTNWDEVTQRGNPTRCPQVNGLIRLMIKAEVARRGMPSQARRSLTPKEFENLMEKIRKEGEESCAVWLAANFCFQYNMMARVDDTAKFRRPDLQAWRAYPEFGVTSKL